MVRRFRVRKHEDSTRERRLKRLTHIHFSARSQMRLKPGRPGTTCVI
jgi:hypothetical protein